MIVLYVDTIHLMGVVVLGKDVKGFHFVIITITINITAFTGLVPAIVLGKDVKEL
jgi:hypothetical protein